MRAIPALPLDPWDCGEPTLPFQEVKTKVSSTTSAAPVARLFGDKFVYELIRL